MTRAIYVDIEKCDGCGDCVEACREAHESSCIRVIEISSKYIPVSCHHCEDPKCVASCKKQAIEKTKDGPVIISAEKCTGCQACVVACVNGGIEFNPDTKKASKCDLCAKKEIPACVSVCKQKALVFGEINALTKQAMEKAADDVLKGKKVFPNYYFMTIAQAVKK